MAQHAAGFLRGGIIGLSVWTALGVTSSLADAGTARTVGLMAPVWLLGGLVLAGMLAGFTTVVRRLPWGLVVLTLLVAAAWAPLSPIAAIHAWSGAPALVLFGLVAAASAAFLRPDRLPIADGPIAPWIAWALAAIWLGAIWRGLGAHAVTGDEPHYLLIAQSILADGDFDLANNYAARDYQGYYSGLLEPRHVSLGRLGQEYSFHAPAAALLALPAFALGGPSAARLLVVLLTAAGAGFMWAAARRLTGSAGAAWASWAALVTSAPMALHASMIYPDAIGAAATSVGLWTLVRAESRDIPGPLALVASGAALALHPWLHIRLSLVAAALGVAILVSLWRANRGLAPIAWFLIVPSAAALLLFWTTWAMFGTLDPTAVFRQKAAGSLNAAPAGVLGLLFDQEYGLLPYAPAFAAPLLGLLRVRRARSMLAAGSAMAAIGTLVLAASWIWWGGQSGPARFLVPVLPIVALWLAAWWCTACAGLRTLTLTGIVMTACWTTLLVGADRGAYVVNDPDGAGTLFEWMSHSVNLGAALPSLFRAGATPASEGAVAAIWSSVAILVALAMRAQRGRARTPVGLWAMAAMLSAGGLSLGAGLGWWWRDVSPWTPNRAAVAVLHAAGRSWYNLGVTGPPPRLRPPNDVLASLAIEAPRLVPPAAALHVPFVPAGRYRIETQSIESSPEESGHTFVLELGRNAWPMTTWVASSAQGPSFVLPVPIWAVRVASPEGSQSSWRVLLRPLEVWSRPSSSQGFAWRATRYGDLVVFSMDPSSYPESAGMWLGGSRRTSILVADLGGRASPVRLQFEAGSAPVEISLTCGARWATSLVLSAHERAHVEVPVAEGGGPEPIHADLKGAFSASDGRQLGVWLSVVRSD